MPGNSALSRTSWRLIAAISGICIAMVAILSFDLADNRRQVVAAARQNSENMSRLLSERMDASIREVDYVLLDMVDRLSAYPSTGKAELTRLVAAKRATLPHASALAILDPWGRSIAASPADLDTKAERSCVGAFTSDGSLNASTQAAFGAEAGASGGSLLRARAIRDRDGSLVAVVVAKIDLSVVRSELADLELGNHRVIVVTDSMLRLVARRPEMPDAIGVEVVEAGIRSLLRSLKGAGLSLDSMRSETGPYYYYARAGQFPFYIVIGEASSDIMSEWDRRLLIFAIALGVIVALVVSLGRLMAKNFARSAELAARIVAMESASDMIVIAGLDGKAEYVNPAFERTTGMPKAEALGSRRAIFGLEEADAEAALAAAISGQSWRGEIAASRADGEGIVEEVTIAPVLDPSGKPVRIVAVLRDVTERRRLQERLERLAHYDPLTALPNRALFFDRLEGAVARARREERRFALLFIDLDGFKAVNDRFGHDAGDYLLFEIARRLRGAIRDSDTAGRMGGDEFTVLLENITRPEDAVAVADKIREALTEPAMIPAGAAVRVGASVGIAVFPEDGADGESILKAADSAMYAIKLATGDRR
jgi:diguanylate cyclase (GGDEF)-like protein/PAS domain S-box-containing protein